MTLLLAFESLSTDQLLGVALWVLGFVIAFVAFGVKMVLALRDESTRAKEKAGNYREEMERRIVELKADVERRLQERRDDILGEKVLIDLKIKAINDLHTTQNDYLREELDKIVESIASVHRRLDDFMNGRNQHPPNIIKG